MVQKFLKRYSIGMVIKYHNHLNEIETDVWLLTQRSTYKALTSSVSPETFNPGFKCPDRSRSFAKTSRAPVNLPTLRSLRQFSVVDKPLRRCKCLLQRL